MTLEENPELCKWINEVGGFPHASAITTKSNI
jgi:hypothetical protein